MLTAPPATDTKPFLESTQKIFGVFRECKEGDLFKIPFCELEVKENEGEFEKTTEESIKRSEHLTDKFKKATKESIKQSEHLTEYAADMVQFAEFCIEPDNTADDFSEGITSILNRAKSNNQKTSEILNEYLAIANGLAIIKNTIEILIRNKEHIELKSVLIKAGVTVAVIGGTVAVLAVPAATAIAMIIGKIAAVIRGPVILGAVAGSSAPVALGGAVGISSAAVVVRNTYAKENGKQIKLSKEEIEKFKKEIVTVGKLKEHLNKITELVSTLQGFWQSHVDSLENLVRKMERSSDAGEQPTIKPLSKFDARCVKNKWKKFEEENLSYTEALRRITIEDQI